MLLLLAGLAALVAAYKSLRIWPHASSLRQRAHTLQALAAGDLGSLATPEGVASIREQLGAARDDLISIRAEVRFLLPAAERVGWVPRVGGDIAAAPALLDLGVELCDAGWWGLLGVEPTMDSVSKTGGSSGQTALQAALPVLAASQPRFAEAEQALGRAQAAYERLQGRDLSPFLRTWVLRLGEYLPSLNAAAQLAQVAPGLLGQKRPVTYLILAQNNHELRATGGFISGSGVIQLSKGEIVTATFQDSYRVDGGCDYAAHPPAPAPLRKYMWAPVLMFRDANWSPDFPSSATVASSIYRLCRRADFDGVIGIDLDAVVQVLRGLGAIQPAGYPAPVTSETFVRFVEQYWTAPLRSSDITEKDTSDWWSHRKDIMADVLQAALQKITTSPQSIDMSTLLRSLLESFRGRHLLVYLRDAAAARGMEVAGWDGALRFAPGNYLAIVDSNVGFRKVNPNIRQSAEYRVDLTSIDAPQARLTLRYKNESKGLPECIAGSHYDESYEEMKQGCYWDYVRVYVPRGSRLRSIAGGDSEPEASEEAGKAVFSTLLVVAPGQSRELVFTYDLPPMAARGSQGYRLLVQKQAGSLDYPVQLDVSGGEWRLTASHPDISVTDNRRRASFKLARDTELRWIVRSGSGAQTAWKLVGAAGAVMVLAGLAIWRPGLRYRRNGPSAG